MEGVVKYIKGISYKGGRNGEFNIRVIQKEDLF